MLSANLPVSEIIIILGFGGSVIFLSIGLLTKAPIFHKDLLAIPIIVRTLCELFGALFFVLAIALTPLSSASAILQVVPLLVTIGAAIFFKEKVGWRRWSAVFVGFLGVLLILRPGFGSFMPASIFALLGAIFLAGRDLATRAIKVKLPSVTISLYAFLAFGLSGILVIPFSSEMLLPSSNEIIYFAGASAFGVIAYYSIVIAARVGEMSVISPFRYSRLVFAMLLSIVVLSERPDMWTLLGAAIIVASGVYTFIRENLMGKTKERIL
jgi:drug/metabolite transporter (DMT)-like permease